MLLSCLHGLCAFPNMVIDINIARKSGKKREKRTDMMQTVVDNTGVLFTCSVCISQYGNRCKYTQKIRKKRETKNGHDVDCCWQYWGTVYMVCAHFQIWSVMQIQPNGKCPGNWARDTFPGYSECICSRKQEFSAGNSKGFEMREQHITLWELNPGTDHIAGFVISCQPLSQSDVNKQGQPWNLPNSRIMASRAEFKHSMQRKQNTSSITAYHCVGIEPRD